MKVAKSHSAEDEVATWAPLLELAARQVFSTVLGESLDADDGLVQNEPLDITSMVGLAGRVRGVISVRCSRRAAALIASRMLADGAPHRTVETWDALGEVCNMVAGNLKNKVAGLAADCMISVPTVIAGADYYVHPFGENKRAQVRLSFQRMQLIIAIEVHR